MLVDLADAIRHTMPHLLLIHGALADGRMWRSLQSGFPDVTVMAPTLQGFFPATTVPHTFSAAQHVDELEAMVEGCRRPLTIVGFSRGGRLALELASRLGAELDSLVLAEPGGVMTDDFLPNRAWKAGGGTDAMRQAIAAAIAGKSQDAARIYIDAGHGAGTFARAPAVVRDGAIANVHTLAAMMSDRTIPLSRASARAVRCQTTVVHARRSPPIFREIAEVLASEIPGARLADAGDFDHFFPALPEARFDTLVSDALAR